MKQATLLIGRDFTLKIHGGFEMEAVPKAGITSPKIKITHGAAVLTVDRQTIETLDQTITVVRAL